MIHEGVRMVRQPTVYDVAEAAGVSRQTVSNVLNAPEIVKEATRRRVETAISDLGYRPHASARRLRTRKSSTIGIRLDPLTNGISGSVLDRFLHALTEQADARGMRVLLFTATDPADEIRQFERLLDGADVDGFVLTSTTYDDPRTEWLLTNEAPFVTFGRPWGVDDMDDPRRHWVDVDGRHGVAEATRSLLELNARRIAYLGWPSPSGTGDERRRGWREAMESSDAVLSGAELDALQLSCEDGVGQGSEAVRAVLADGVTIDGVVCASDSLALGALMVLGQSVPIVGYDNTPVAAAVGLSSIEQPLEQVAAAALELLLGAGAGAAGAAGGTAAGEGPALLGEPGSSGDPNHRLLRPRTVWR